MWRLAPFVAAICALGVSSARAAPDAPEGGVRPAVASPAETRSATPRHAARARVVAVARRHLGERFRGDCTGFVRLVYREAHVPLPADGGSESMYRALVRVRRPRPGDLAFFHHTYDREPPGPRRNLLTHVALVESVHGPSVSLIHRSGTGIRRLTMNLAHPADPHRNGAVRRRRPGDRPGQRYLASELFAGYASAFRERQARATSR